MTEKEILEIVAEKGWYYVSRNVKLSEEFMEKYWDNLEHSTIACKQKLSEGFIDKYWNDLIYTYVLFYNVVSSSFFEKHWSDFSGYQRKVCRYCSNNTKRLKVLGKCYYYCPICQR